MSEVFPNQFQQTLSTKSNRGYNSYSDLNNIKIKSLIGPDDSK